MQAGESLEEQLGQRLLRMPPPAQVPARMRSGTGSISAPGAASTAAPLEQLGWRLPEEPAPLSLVAGPGSYPEAGQGAPGPDDWEIDISQLHIEAKVAAGSFSNLYKGYYCGQEVAVKILKDVADDASQYQEFLQEVSAHLAA